MLFVRRANRRHNWRMAKQSKTQQHTHTHTRERAHAGLAIKYKQLAYIAIAGLSSILFIYMCMVCVLNLQTAFRLEQRPGLSQMQI